MDILVIGAGVSGLTTGICLAEAGHTVTIRTAAPPERTTSIAAGALWGPVRVGPPDRALVWAEQSLAVMTQLAAEPGTGVHLVSGQEMTRTEPDLPFWSHLLPSMRLCEPAELPPGFVGGWHYTAPLATMPVYLGYLLTRFEQAGGKVELSAITALAGSSFAGAPVVVNCSGIAARDLVPDPSVYPVRGQVVIAENPGVEEFFISRDESPPDTVYMFPHGDTVLIGGTVEENDWDLTPNPIISERIVANAAGIESRLNGVRILDYRVGLRPCRPEVRLESERIDDTLVWHNYGHGGAGISVSWGCAAEIAGQISGSLTIRLPLTDSLCTDSLCEGHLASAEGNMWEYEHSVETTATAEALWRHWSDMAAWPTWNEGIEKIEVDGPFQVGTRFTMTPPGEDPVSTRQVSMRLTEIVPGELFADEMDAGDFVVRTAHQLESLADGRTRITYRTEITGPAADQVGPELGPAITADFPDVLAALARLARAHAD